MKTMYYQIIVIFFLISFNTNAGVIINDSATFEWGYDFEGPLEGYFTGELDYQTITFGENFIGQTVNDGGVFETLSELNASSLSLQTNSISSDNLGLFWAHGQKGIYGGNNNDAGTGSIAILLKNTADIFQFSLFDGDFGDFTINFYSDKADLIGSYTQTAIDSALYGYRVESGERIAGVTITNNDAGGMGISFVQEYQIEKVPEPHSALLFCLSLAMLLRVNTQKKS